MSFEEKRGDIIDRIYEVCAVNGLTVQQVDDVAHELKKKAEAQISSRISALYNEILD